MDIVIRAVSGGLKLHCIAIAIAYFLVLICIALSVETIPDPFRLPLEIPSPVLVFHSWCVSTSVSLPLFTTPSLRGLKRASSTSTFCHYCLTRSGLTSRLLTVFRFFFCLTSFLYSNQSINQSLFQAEAHWTTNNKKMQTQETGQNRHTGEYK